MVAKMAYELTCYSEKNFEFLNLPHMKIGPLQFTITWYENNHAGEQTTHWDIQNKRILS